MEFTTRQVLPHEKGHKSTILELGTRSTPDSPWSFSYAEYLKSKAIRSNVPARKVIQRFVKNLARYGRTRFQHPEDCRDVGPGNTKTLVELKPKDHRLLLFQPDERTWIIVDAFKKPKRKQQSSYIERADELRREYLKELSSESST